MYDKLLKPRQSFIITLYKTFNIHVSIFPSWKIAMFCGDSATREAFLRPKGEKLQRVAWYRVWGCHYWHKSIYRQDGLWEICVYTCRWLTSAGLLHRVGGVKQTAWPWHRRSISQMKHQLDATLCRLYFCRVTLYVSGAFSFGPNKEMWWLTCNDNTCNIGRPTSFKYSWWWALDARNM